jgi:hypothetical protein
MARPDKKIRNAAAPENPALGWSRPSGVWAGAVCLALLVLGLTGCTLLRYPTSPPTAEIKSLLPTASQATNIVSVTVMQAEVMRFADVYASTVAQAADDFGAKLETPEGRVEAHRWKLGQATSIYVDATGPNPSLNALDMLVLVTLSRMVAEDHLVKVFGDAALPLLETHRRLEANAWEMASGALKPPQQQELRDLIDEWRRKNPDQRYIGAIRFREFVTALGRMPRPGSTAPTSIFSMLFLDPMAGLDPTVAAIEETRLLGERAMYYSQRMPTLLSWQLELLAYEIAAQPESRQVLADAERLTKSAESFAKTGQELPQVINDQRQAGIQQLLDGLKSQATDVRQTLNAGSEAATAINATIKSLDEFVRYVAPPATNPATASTNSKSFDVLDYGKAAGQIAEASRDLNTLLASINQSAPLLAQMGQKTTANANSVVDRAFTRGLILISMFLIGWVVVGLIYRILVNKLIGDGHKPSRPESQIS